jgi:hypothetical protein
MKIKQLEWKNETVVTPFGTVYAVGEYKNQPFCLFYWECSPEMTTIRPFASKEEAKAACQEDYEKRILSAFETEEDKNG